MSVQDAGATAESVRKKLKTGREHIDDIQRQVNVVEDSVTISAESDDRLYDMFIVCFTSFTLFEVVSLVCNLF